VAPLTLVFWRRGLDWDISYGMESTPSSRSVSLGWKLLVLLLLAAGVVLGMIAAKQTNTHAEIELLNIANLCSNVALMTVGVYWITEAYFSPDLGSKRLNDACLSRPCGVRSTNSISAGCSGLSQTA
jgi:hypothetical protein